MIRAGDRLGVDAGSTMNWFLPDLHGSVAASLSASESTVTNAIRYDAWGDTLVTGAGGGSAVGADIWKYQGRLDVSPSGIAEPLYDMSARFYSPSLGQFTQLDSELGSAQNPLSMNRFLYAHSNPATLIDPSGHAACRLGPEDCAAVARSSAARSAAANKRSKYLCNRYGECGRQKSPTPRYRFRQPRRYSTNEFRSALFGVRDGVVNFAAAPADLAIHIGTNLDKIPRGIGRLASDPGGSIQALAKTSGFDDPVGNFLAGISFMQRQSTHDKWQFLTEAFLSGVTLRTALPGRRPAPPTTTPTATRAAAAAQESRLPKVFDEAGGLTPEALAGSKPIALAEPIGEAQVVAALTRAGGSLAEWTKMRSPSFPTTNPLGRAQVHFYTNTVTGAVSYFGARSVFNKFAGQKWEMPTMEEILASFGRNE